MPQQAISRPPRSLLPTELWTALQLLHEIIYERLARPEPLTLEEQVDLIHTSEQILCLNQTALTAIQLAIVNGLTQNLVSD